MTNEELKQQFYKYIKDHEDYFDPREPWTERIILQIWLDCAEPREKRIAELVKENAEYKELFGGCSTCKRTCDIGNCCDPRTKNGYLVDKVRVIAERQKLLKENAELEQKLEQAEKDLADYQFNYPTIKELEKKNAELKRDKEDLIFIRNQKADYINELKYQLTKAKELIEDMYDAIPSSHSDYYKNVMERARQFLREVEK